MAMTIALALMTTIALCTSLREKIVPNKKGCRNGVVT